MEQKVTSGVSISVETFYQEDDMMSESGRHFFAYRITIENIRTQAIQLLARKWWIFDSNGDKREVAGEGVVGEQPIIEPGETYQYVSGCEFRTEIGKMSGYYQMITLPEQTPFIVDIPAFIMMTPAKLN